MLSKDPVVAAEQRKHMSDATKKVHADSQWKGTTNRYTPESIDRMRQARLGTKQSQETIENRAAKLRGRKRPPRSKEWCDNIKKSKQNTSEETRKKMSEAQKGKVLSEETKQKLREASLNCSEEARKKMSVAAKGKSKSESHRSNISKGKTGVPRPDMARENNWQNDISKRLFGSKNPNYTGTSPLMIQIRKLQQYYDWRLAVFTRDNFTSVISGIEGNGNLNAHHLVELSKLVKQYNITTSEEAARCNELWDVNNGITILDCEHVSIHKKFKEDNNM